MPILGSLTEIKAMYEDPIALEVLRILNTKNHKIGSDLPPEAVIEVGIDFSFSKSRLPRPGFRIVENVYHVPMSPSVPYCALRVSHYVKE